MDPIAVTATSVIKSKTRINTESSTFFITTRTILSTLILFASVLIPKFHSVIGIIGAALTSVTGYIFPTLSYLKMHNNANRPLHYLIISFFVTIAVLGTIGAISSIKN